ARLRCVATHLRHAARERQRPDGRAHEALGARLPQVPSRRPLRRMAQGERLRHVRPGDAHRRHRAHGPADQSLRALRRLRARVMGGGEIFNEDLREYADRARMIADLEKDPQGIAYAALGYRTAGVKAIALAESPAGPFVAPTRESVAARSYPLARPVYMVYTIDNEKTEIANPRVD